MHRVGPYTFTDRDAQATFDCAVDLLDLFPASAHDHLRPYKERVKDALVNVDDVGARIQHVFTSMLEARQALVDSSSTAPTQQGSVLHLATSDGGVPKGSVDAVEVDYTGVVSDRQATRRRHGRPWQALSLWSAAVIDELATEHPIFYGAAGENITIGGVDWASLSMGTLLRIGTVEAQVTAPAIPCSQLTDFFSDGDFNRIHFSKGPVSRLYATVLTPGAIATGDPVIVEPTGSAA